MATKHGNMTIKQRRWLKEYIKSGNATEAAMIAYNCKEISAGNIGYENTKKLDLSGILNEMGLDDHGIAKGLTEGSNADKVVVVKDKAHSVPDYGVRHRYYDTILKVKGDLSDRLEVTGKDGEEIKVNFSFGERNYVPRGIQTITSSERDTDERRPQIQSADMAPKGKEDNDSDNRIGTTSTP